MSQPPHADAAARSAPPPPGEAAFSRREWLWGARLFLAVGLVFAGMYLVAPEGPWKWLAGAVAVVSLVRSMGYAVRARRAAAARADGQDPGGSP
ncbi:MAG: hypothetical protein ACK4PI_10490 [Tepidisphaerales bacterium]